jgi:uncharacterized SAM-binding protein YcdF (DUF218 family)
MIRKIGIAIAAIGWLWLVGWMLFLIGVTVERPEKLDQKTDAIIVLTGGQNRINSGLDLLAAGKAQYLFISGVNPTVSIEHLVRMWKPDFEYIPCCIVLGLAANDTEGNARESSQWARDQGIKSIRLLTSNYHLPRAWLEFTHALPLRTILTHPIKPTSADYDSKHMIRLSFSEYNKTLLTWARLYIYPWKYKAK